MKTTVIPKRYRYEIEYFVTDDGTGKHKKKKEVEFTKPQDKWERSEWETLTKFLQVREYSKRCDVSIISIKPVETKN